MEVLSVMHLKHCIHLVKIILLKSDNCALVLRKRLFCNAKQPLLPCKTYAFEMQLINENEEISKLV